jgi:hypothetical protein
MPAPPAAGTRGATGRAGALLVFGLAAGWLSWRLRPGPVDRDPVDEIVVGCA